jgi:hypothetical protein
MTNGLLISRNQKNRLHKKFIAKPTAQNIANYKQYRNIFNSLLRKSKILYFESNLKENEKNPKKTWDILRETIGKKTNQKISEININGVPSNDPSLIAHEFNNFFSSIGTKISREVDPVDKDPLSYIPFIPNTPVLELGGTDANEVRNFLSNTNKKNSLMGSADWALARWLRRR